MEFHRINFAQHPLFAPAFALYKESFPAHEQRLLAAQAALLPNPYYRFEVITQGGAFAGILLSWQGAGYAYIEHFAILPALRSHSAGSKSLALFCAKHPLVILEIDPPLNPTARRREGFYRRLGFHTNTLPHRHPAYQPQFSPHELVVMSCPAPLSEEEYRLFCRELSGVFMQDAPAARPPSAGGGPGPR